MSAKRKLAAVITLTLPLVACGTTAVTPFPSQQILTGQIVNQADADVVTESYRIVQLDNQEGQLAATQSSNPQVRAIAAELISRANRLYPGLEEQIRRTGITPPRTLPEELQGKLNHIRTLRGQAFDRQYLSDQIDTHQRAAKIFQNGLSRTQDAGIRAVLEQALPVVQEDLARLMELKATIG